MKTIIKNILVLLGGCIFGSVVNMGLIIVGNQLIPVADGMNPMDATMWEIRYFIFPFLAHAIGTLSGAFTAGKFSFSYHLMLAICIGVFFLAGGIYMVFILPAPIWFISVDLILAYIPMAWLGWKLSGKINYK